MALILRSATLADAEMMLSWRAADEQASPWWQGEPVDRERHLRWFRERVDNPAVRLWIAEMDGVLVGDTRVDSNGEVTYNVLPEHRGQGLGTKILVATTSLASSWDGWRRLKANVDSDNLASRRVLEKAGWKHRPDVEFWRWPE